MKPEIGNKTKDYGSSYLNQLWQTASGALVLCDANRQILKINSKFTELFHFSAQDCLGSNIEELITPAPFLPESDFVFKTTLSGTPVSIITVKQTIDEKLVNVFQIAVQVLSDSDDRLICYIFKAIARNTRQRTSDKVSDTELLNNAFENSFEAALYSNSEGEITRVNTAFLSEFGWSSDEITGQDISSIMIPPTIKPESEYINAMQRSGRILRLKTIRKKKDLSTQPVSLVCIPQNNDSETGYRIYSTSISAAQTSADVVARNDFKTCPSQGLHSGMFFQAKIDNFRTMEFISPGSASFAGYTEVELLSQVRPFATIILNEDRSMVLSAIEESLKNKEDYSITYRILNSFGDTLWVMERGKTFKLDGDKSNFCVGCIIDISETQKSTKDSSMARERIEKLHHIAARLQQCRSEGEIYRICTEAGQTVLNSACSSVFIMDDSELKQIASSGRELHDCSINCNPGMVELTLSTVSPCYFSARDIGDNLCPAGNSGACFRLSDKAVFQIISKSNSVFGNIDTRITELLLGYTQQNLKRITLQHQLISQALHDPLTGVHNRNYFNRIIELEEIRARRLGSSIGFIMVDIDKFKLVNDNYGHQTGDEVLIEVAKILGNALRKTDTVLRYGGDEFLIILTRMKADYCHLVENRIKNSMTNSNQLKMNDGTKITVSMGHAFWVAEAHETVDEVLRLADKIMYENKRKKFSTE